MGSVDEQDLHVLIIGAGITGALIAQGLKQAGIRCTIFDAELAQHAGRTRDWTISLHWALPLLKKLLPEDLSARMHETKCDSSHHNGEDETICLYNSKTGEQLKEVRALGMIRISRRKLRALCNSDLPVMFGKALTTVTYNTSGAAVTARFADGSSYSGDIVIGADGPGSKVRELLVGVEESKTTPLGGVVFNSTIVHYNDAEKAKHARSASPTFAVGYHPDGMLHTIAVQEVPDPLRPETWSFQLGTSQVGAPEDYGTDSASRLAAIKKAALKLAEPFRSANLWVPDGTNTWRDQHAYWVPTPWDNHGGRVTLAGDAAHPMPPHRGQGLNHSIVDAHHLVAALSEVHSGEAQLPEAVSTYDKEMVTRSAEEVRLTVETALMVHDWPRLMESGIMKHGLGRR